VIVWEVGPLDILSPAELQIELLSGLQNMSQIEVQVGLFGFAGGFHERTFLGLDGSVFVWLLFSFFVVGGSLSVAPQFAAAVGAGGGFFGAGLLTDAINNLDLLPLYGEQKFGLIDKFLGLEGGAKEGVRLGFQLLAVERVVASRIQPFELLFDGGRLLADEEVVDEGLEGFDDGRLGGLGVEGEGRTH